MKKIKWTKEDVVAWDLDGDLYDFLPVGQDFVIRMERIGGYKLLKVLPYSKTRLYARPLKKVKA